MTNSNDVARDDLALALDVDDLVVALRVGRPLLDYFSVAKVGLELFAASGPEAVVALSTAGFDVFVDLKLHDIRRPSAVRRGAWRCRRVLRNSAHLRWSRDGSRRQPRQWQKERRPQDCHFLASSVSPSSRAMPRRRPTSSPAGRASQQSAGCGGIVCAASDLAVVAVAAPGLRRVVPGIRPAQVGHDDQARVATPSAALRAGADLLVIGRAVTGAADPRLRPLEFTRKCPSSSQRCLGN